MANTGFIQTVRREVRRMCSRKMYIAGMVFVPVMMLLFFVSLLGPGLPLKVPSAIVDNDHSTMSRQVIRSLNASELIDITEYCESYDQAMDKIRRGEVFGFFVIPPDFEKDAVSGRTPTLEYYNNLTYFVPGTLTFKGFKTIAVTVSGGVAKSMIVSVGADDNTASALLQPMVFDPHPMGNPWLSYAIYLCPTFMICLLGLMIYLMTTFAITMEIKNGTSPDWIATARGHMSVAIAGKLLPHFVVWSVVGQLILAVLFGFEHFPCSHPLTMMVAMELFIIACQGYALFFVSLVPNPRLAFIICALTGILTFSVAGLSFPVQEMYGAVGIFSYLLPPRYMILIYFFSALNDFPLYYSRIYFAALIIFPLLPAMLMGRLKRACLQPVYVP